MASKPLTPSTTPRPRGRAVPRRSAAAQHKDQRTKVPMPNPVDPNDRARQMLMFILTGLVVVLAISTVFWPDAGSVLDRIMPLLTMVVGYFFGHQTKKLRP